MELWFEVIHLYFNCQLNEFIELGLTWLVEIGIDVIEIDNKED